MEFIRNSGRGLGMGENIITLALAPDKKKKVATLFKFFLKWEILTTCRLSIRLLSLF